MILNTYMHAPPLQGTQPRHEAKPAPAASASTAAPVQPVATAPEWSGAVAALRMTDASEGSALRPGTTGADVALPDPDLPTGPRPSFQANELDVLPEKLRREIIGNGAKPQAIWAPGSTPEAEAATHPDAPPLDHRV